MKYNDFLDLLMTRHSCRSFLDKDVPDEIVSEIMLAGRCAPSSHNSQANIIIRLKDKHLRNCLEANLRKMMQMPDSFHPFYDAPEVIAVLNFGDDASLRLLDGACVM